MLDFIESVDDIPFWLSFLYIIAPIFLYIMFYRDVHQFRRRFTKYNKRTLGLFFPYFIVSVMIILDIETLSFTTTTIIWKN